MPVYMVLSNQDVLSGESAESVKRMAEFFGNKESYVIVGDDERVQEINTLNGPFTVDYRECIQRMLDCQTTFTIEEVRQVISLVK